ncbi:related to TAP42 - component of the Tor signaling pathway [Ustilago trichophora]|uniref:Related to TAP42 - component of the Tor signaling pathway n=1 Tax=Ustilago trichophora TaxID=86804 RepID=A0A5C3EK68_9BASI|nr:related to TAP42 - component of the Tor signaling pathway [Ustilago trichophora]
MSGQTLNDLISTVFLRASDPPPPPPPVQFDPRSSSTSNPTASSSSTSSSPDPAEQTLALINRAQQISDSIGVISPNDALRDISTSSLRTLFLPSLAAELHAAVRTGTDHTARKQRLGSSQQAAAKFLNRVLAIGVVPPSTKQLVGWSCSRVDLTSLGVDANAATTEGVAPPHAREVKIAVFKLERALKENLERYRLALQGKKKVTDKVPGDVYYDLLLYTSSQSNRGDQDGSDAEEEDDEEDAVNETTSTTAPGGIASIRQYLLALLNLHTLRNAQHISSASQELELLRSMPPPPPPSTTTNISSSDPSSSEWRLDRSTGSTLPTSGPLLAPSGKVLRPFTISNKTRSQLSSEVFRPDHRLPTMSIDEYLEEEQRRGNIIQGGGQASYDKPTSTEQRKLRAEMDGSKDAEEAEEEQRQKDLYWDTFTEQNKRGAGNTMNRG